MPLGLESLEELKRRLSPDLKVLIIVISDAWGGLEQTAISDAVMLSESGFQVYMLLKKNSPMHNCVEENYPGLVVDTYNQQIRNLFDINFFKTIRKVIKKRKINLIHCHQSSILGTVVPSLTSHKRIALVVSRHILNDHNKRDPYHVLLYRRVDYILVLSKTMRNNLSITLPVAEKKLRIVNLGLNLKNFDINTASRDKMRKLWNIDPKTFLIGVVGRLDPMKGQDILIKALAQLKNKIENLHVIVVGAETPGLDGEYLKELKKTISDLRLKEHVSIVGPQENVPEVMAALDLFVMPSYAEAFGLVALEAMSMGVPTLLSNAGSATELVAGCRGELFRPGDAFDLSRKIRNLYRNEDYRKALAKRATQFVYDLHSMDYRLHKTLDVYARCRKRRRVSLGHN